MVVLVGAVVGFSLLGRPKTAFEWEQTRAEASSPKWIKVEITTADGRREYRQGEPITVLVHFSSARRYTYKADAADGGSRAAMSDLLHISNGQTRPRSFYGVVCCDTRLIGLDEEPFTPRLVSPLRLAPGEYEIYLTSRRVFKWDDTNNSLHPSTFEVASNLLKIRVLP
jgi:hypothetical protein